MAVIFFTGFELGNPNGDLCVESQGSYYTQNWSETYNNFPENEGNYGNRFLEVTWSNVSPGKSGAIFYFPERDEIYGQFYLNKNTSLSTGYILEIMYQNTVLMTLYQKPYLKYEFYSGRGTAGTKYGTFTDYMKTRRWICIEFHIKLHATEGVIEFKMNGKSQFVYTGNTKIVAKDYIDRIRLGSNEGNKGFCNYDNVVIFDTTGTKNNSWVNGKKVIFLKPSAAGTYSQFTPATGDNYTNVNVLPYNTNYVKGKTNGIKDSYNLESLDDRFTKIIAIQPTFLGYRSQDDVTKIKPFIITNSQTYEYTELNVPLVDYIPIQTDIIETNPITSNDFTVEEINNIELGMECVT